MFGGPAFKPRQIATHVRPEFLLLAGRQRLAVGFIGCKVEADFGVKSPAAVLQITDRGSHSRGRRRRNGVCIRGRPLAHKRQTRAHIRGRMRPDNAGRVAKNWTRCWRQAGPQNTSMPSSSSNSRSNGTFGKEKKDGRVLIRIGANPAGFAQTPSRHRRRVACRDEWQSGRSMPRSGAPSRERSNVGSV